MSISEIYKIYLKHPVVCTDTRKISQGCLFFALKGDKFDANQFAQEALNQGAAFAVVDDARIVKNEKFILVDDVLKTLQDLASYHRKALKIPVIGLTGSNGKTTTKELIYAVLSQKFKTYATVGNLNNHIGVPLTLLAITPAFELAIVEMGANHQQEIALLSEICQPDFGLITNVGKAHLEGFGGFEGVKKGKGELYTFLEQNGGTVFVNEDNLHLQDLLKHRKFKETIYYGTSGKGLVQGKLIANNPFLEVEWHYKEETFKVKSQLTGTYNFENILAAIAIGLRLGLNAVEINYGIANYAPQNNRSQIIKTAKNTIIGDFYNANPSSMQVAIDNIVKLEAAYKVLILGDMFELGDETLAEHTTILNKIKDNQFNEVYLVGHNFYKLKHQYPYVFFETAEACKQYLSENPLTDGLLLLKGSRGMKLEVLLDVL
ncbi:UDP-N-acetylmuramoyl-tripeptide--D-alanyl-D-alanine ligase [Pedobacter glucosidilyticus]|uniref:UDP-N-acetylmuramoyl-tripeptide--D-alanyl-D- alanine ligase n=1 Tax=Pedobacter glucosidilyticus TaxID=1122941 RepID=UPI0026F341F9|nr:UDP-N-acetylmuramoyl-tripeptide--D-alanyl-D-alanine ligase [Pedobacter glucosidilyticus]